MRFFWCFFRFIRSVRCAYWLLLFLFAGIVALYWLYTGMPDINGGSYFYRWLGEAFLEGHTYLDKMPDPRLAQLQDPYDAVQNAPFVLQDASYFNGKFYLYFGPVPVLLVWMPIKLLTGVSVNEPVLLFVLATVGTCTLSLLVYLIAARQGITHCFGLLLAILSIAYGSWIPFLLRQANFYETAVAGAYCCTALGALFLWLFMTRGERYHWLGLASLFFGLAAGCRIIHLASVIFLLLVFLYYWRQKKRPMLVVAFWAFWPWLMCMMGLGIYNYVRFGSSFELGARYVLTILGNMHSPDFHFLMPSRILTHAYYYLLHPLPWDSLSFPFFTPGRHQLPWRTMNHLAWYDEPLYGLFTNSPFSLFFLLFLCDWRRFKQWTTDACVMLGGIGIYSGVIFAFLLMYFFSTARYEVDFAPWFMALAGLYYLQLLKTSRHYKLLLWVGGLLALYGVFTGITAGWCSYQRCE